MKQIILLLFFIICEILFLPCYWALGAIIATLILGIFVIYKGIKLYEYIFYPKYRGMK